VILVVVVFGRRLVRCFGQLQALGLLVLFGSRSAVAPLPGAVDCVLVRLKLDLVLERHVAFDSLLVQGDLQQLAGVDEGPGLLAFLAGSGARFGAVFCAVGRQAFYCRDVSLCDGIIVEVLEACDTEDVPTVQHAMANGAFLGF
jgi:hypothetical protein